jgi:putative SOS response-associated peptidase YedK
MCGRYGFYRTDEFGERFGVDVKDDDIKPNYNAAPGQFLPVIRKTEKGKVLEVMKWGLVPVWAKDINIGYKMINARSESVFEKNTWRGPVRHHRCLVPADYFYEWDKILDNGKSQKQPYLIKPKDQELFAFAGIYDTWHDAHGNELWSFSIITTAANKDMARLHDREPVILKPEEEDLWLDPSVQDRDAIEALLHMYPDGKFEMYEVSRDVNVVKNNDKRLIVPINSQ